MIKRSKAFTTYVTFSGDQTMLKSIKFELILEKTVFNVWLVNTKTKIM